MPFYNYTAKKLSGGLVKGRAKSEDKSALMSELMEKQLFLLDAEEAHFDEKHSRFDASELTNFTREIGMMLSTGITLVQALQIYINRDGPEKKKKVYRDIYKALQSGYSFSDSLKLQAGVFPSLFISMIYAGEISGGLSKAVLQMADYYEKENKTSAKIKGAMVYPIVLLVLTILIVIVIFTVILPNFFTMFKGMELPLPTKIVIAISNFLTSYWYIALGILAVLAILFGLAFQKEAFRISLDKMKLKIPWIKKLLKIIYTARFARTISALYASGLPLINAVEEGNATVGNKYISSQFKEVISSIKSGVPFSKAITFIDGFDSKLSSIIKIGEESGRLTEMLVSVADSFDFEAEAATQRLITLLEPLMIVFMALIIGSIMISVLLPIMGAYKFIS